jgi:hypothetical protein
MKKTIIYIIRVFGLLLMLLSSFNLIKNIPLLSSMDSIYLAGYLIGALIPMVIGYFLFRLRASEVSNTSLKVKNKEEIKNLLDNEHDSNKDNISLVEYVKPFDTFQSQRDLEDAGLWWHEVHVKQIPECFEDIIKKEDSYTIGWQYPSSASMFDMSVELPIMFTKVDGTDLSLGIALEDLELKVTKREE